LVFWRRLGQLNRSVLRRGLIVGTALGLTNLSFVFGIHGTSISRAGVLNNLFVLFIPLISKIIWRDRIGRANIAGIVLACLGIWLLAGGGAGFNHGDLISTFCALMIAIHIITVSKVLRDDDVYLVSLVQFGTVAAIAAIATLVLPSAPVRYSMTSLGAVTYCAIFPTIICFTIQNTFQRFVTPTRAGLIYTLDPVWSLLAGYAALGERLTGREWLGCTLIFLAAAWPLLLRTLAEHRLVRRYLPQWH
jgi:drug/metabolite transporter (DMT)-like permease